MTDPDSEPSTLRLQFSRALALKEKLGHLPPSDDQYASLLQTARQLLHASQQQARSLALFSPNETVDDIATEDLAYLSIDFHLAELSTRAPGGAPALNQRDERLGQAQALYDAFLGRLQQYELLSAEDARLLERWDSARADFELLASGAGADASARRALKIARYQAEKELKARVQQLDSSQAAADGSAAEENRRAFHLAQLALETHQSFDALDLIAAERRLLAHAAAFPPPPISSAEIQDSRQRFSATTAHSDRLDPPLSSLRGGSNARGPLLDGKGRPQQPFVLTDARAQLRQGVFRSGHRLPTMSIDEYLEAERARGGIIDGGGEQSGQPREVDEDDHAAADRETEKQRAWDEFKEENPKGSGNTLNRG